MSLKKSDKIIAIIGVIILIGAGVGIYLYATTEEEPEEPTKEGDEIKTFDVVYEEISMPIYPDNTDYTIKPSLIGEASWVGNVVDFPQKNLKSININVSYHDNKAGIFWRIGKIRSIGADTLTIIVSDSQDNEIGREPIKGDGNATIPIDIGSLISLEPIEAEDILEAYDILEERFIDYEESYKIRITLKTALWGKLRELLGKDGFKLEVTLTSFEYYLEPSEEI